MLAWCSLSASDAGASKTLAWTQNIGLNEGGNVLVRFYDGVDAASPIRDSGYDADEGNPVTSTVSVSPSAGDRVIALGLSYTPDSDISWSGAGVSEIFEQTANLVNTSWAESSSSGTVTVSATGSYPGLAVIVLKPAPAAISYAPGTIEGSQTLSADRSPINASTGQQIGALKSRQSIQADGSPIVVQARLATAPGEQQVQTELSPIVSQARPATIEGGQTLNADRSPINASTGQQLGAVESRQSIQADAAPIVVQARPTTAPGAQQAKTELSPIVSQARPATIEGSQALSADRSPINASTGQQVGTVEGRQSIQANAAPIVAQGRPTTAPGAQQAKTELSPIVSQAQPATIEGSQTLSADRSPISASTGQQVGTVEGRQNIQADGSPIVVQARPTTVDGRQTIGGGLGIVVSHAFLNGAEGFQALTSQIKRFEPNRFLDFTAERFTLSNRQGWRALLAFTAESQP